MPSPSTPVSSPLLLETEDEYGDPLSTLDNTVYLVVLDTPEPLVHWLSWYDLRATLEQPDTPASERVRYWRTTALPSNYVFRVKDRWYGPMLEPLSRHYNTFVVTGREYMAIGTTVGASQLCNALEYIHAIAPVHRRDVLAYLGGHLSAPSFRARIQPALTAFTPSVTSTGSPMTPASATYYFTPAPEDLVRPECVMAPHHLGLARVVDGGLSGYGRYWRRGARERRQCFSGTPLREVAGVVGDATPHPPRHFSSMDELESHLTTGQPDDEYHVAILRDVTDSFLRLVAERRREREQVQEGVSERARERQVEAPVPAIQLGTMEAVTIASVATHHRNNGTETDVDSTTGAIDSEDDDVDGALEIAYGHFLGCLTM